MCLHVLLLRIRVLRLRPCQLANRAFYHSLAQNMESNRTSSFHVIITGLYFCRSALPPSSLSLGCVSVASLSPTQRYDQFLLLSLSLAPHPEGGVVVISARHGRHSLKWHRRGSAVRHGASRPPPWPCLRDSTAGSPCPTLKSARNNCRIAYSGGPPPA